MPRFRLTSRVDTVLCGALMAAAFLIAWTHDVAPGESAAAAASQAPASQSPATPPTTHLQAAARRLPAPVPPKPICPTPPQVPTSGTPLSAADLVALHLSGLDTPGCRDALDVEGWKQAAVALGERTQAASALDGLWVERAQDPTLVLAGSHGNQPWVALLESSSGSYQARIVVSDSGLGHLADPNLDPTMFPDTAELLLLDAAAVRDPLTGTPHLVIANTHPWVASCWRTLRFAALAPTAQPNAPAITRSETHDGRWCEQPSINITTDGISFDYLGWTDARSLEPGAVWRSRQRAWGWQAGSLVPQFGFAGGDAHDYLLVEDWLTSPWPLAKQATLPSAQSTLGPIHTGYYQRRAPADDASYKVEKHEGHGEQRLRVSCERDSGLVCPEWPTPVDFVLKSNQGRPLIADVRPVAE